MTCPGSLTMAIGIVALSVLTAGPVSTAQAPTGPPAPARPGTGLLIGQVVDGDSQKPVPDALVTIAPNAMGVVLATIIVMGQGTWPVQVQADGNGEFVFSELPAGRYTIAATKPGYAPVAYGMRRPTGNATTLELGDGERRGDVRLTLWKYGALGGTVLDDSGDPVVGVTVRAFRRAYLGGGPRWLLGNGEPPFRLSTVGTATTDDRGVYRIAKLLPGEYIVVVPSTQTTLPLAVAQAIATNDLAPGAQAEILRATLPTPILFNPGGASTTAPLGSANNQVVGGSVWQVQGRSATPPPQTTDGRFFIYPTAFAPAARLSSEAAVVTLRSGEERSDLDVRLTLVPSVRVSGTVTGPNGPVGSVAVRLLAPWAGDFPNARLDAATTVTDSMGAFTFMGVPAGEYTISVLPNPTRPAPGQTSSPRLWAADPLSVGDSDIADVRVVLRPALRVSGRVEFEGQTARPSAAVLGRTSISLVEPADDVSNQFGGPGSVDANGQFTTTGVPPGKYLVRIAQGTTPTGWIFKAATLNGRDVSDTPFELTSEDRDGVVVTFTDRPIQVTGTVRDSQGAPDRSASVVAFTADREAWSTFGISPRRLRTVRADSNGVFTLTDLPAGDYFIVAVPDESIDGSADTGQWLEHLSGVATELHFVDGDKKTVDLRTVTIR